MVTPEMNKLKADLLEINQRINSGRGSKVLKYICIELERGDLHGAQVIHSNEGDKLTQYSGVSDMIRNSIMGCRVHHITGCTVPWCR